VETGLQGDYEYFLLLSCRLCCVIFGNNPPSTAIFFCHCWFSPTVLLRWCCLTVSRACRHNLGNCRSRYT
jgi:hypothetical protein